VFCLLFGWIKKTGGGGNGGFGYALNSRRNGGDGVLFGPAINGQGLGEKKRGQKKHLKITDFTRLTQKSQ